MSACPPPRITTLMFRPMSPTHPTAPTPQAGCAGWCCLPCAACSGWAAVWPEHSCVLRPRKPWRRTNPKNTRKSPRNPPRGRHFGGSSTPPLHSGDFDRRPDPAPGTYRRSRTRRSRIGLRVRPVFGRAGPLGGRRGRLQEAGGRCRVKSRRPRPIWRIRCRMQPDDGRKPNAARESRTAGRPPGRCPVRAGVPAGTDRGGRNWTSRRRGRSPPTAVVWRTDRVRPPTATSPG